jgi:hypothetical protein
MRPDCHQLNLRLVIHRMLPRGPRNNIHAAFESLGNRVRSALQTHVGDAERLDVHRNECLQLLVVVGQVRSVDLCIV